MEHSAGIHPKKETTYRGRPANIRSSPTALALDDLPENWKHFAELNENYVKGGKFQPDEYAKYQAK